MIQSLEHKQLILSNFTQALNDNNPRIRAKAAETLGTLRIEESAQQLVQYLQDQDTSVRFHVAQALGYIRDESVIPQLAHSLNDQDLDR